MKISRIIILAMLFAFVTVTIASAGTQVLKNQATTVAAKVKNTTGNSVRAAVKLTGYDDSGTVIGHLCQEAWLSSYRDADINFSWQAPAYATGVYWSSKVEVNGACASTSDNTVPTYDYHDYDEHDYDEHDDEHSDDADDYHH